MSNRADVVESSKTTGPCAAAIPAQANKKVERPAKRRLLSKVIVSISEVLFLGSGHEVRPVK
jgi:hypothetical protein